MNTGRNLRVGKRFPKDLLTKTERRIFERLTTPEKIQDYLNSLPYNAEDSVQSVRSSIAAGRVHCLEGALVAAAILWYHNETPLLLDLQTTSDDSDHGVALFKRDGLYGALSSTHHSVLRYRDPIYKTMREVALSYFHEYFLDSGIKTMRAYSQKPFALSQHRYDWLFGDDDLYDLGAKIDDMPHTPIAPSRTISRLRKADKVEREAGKLLSILRQTKK